MVSNVMVMAGGGPGRGSGWEPAASPVDMRGPTGLGAVMRIRPFRRLWLVLGLSALGDWLGLLAAAAFASAQVTAPAAKGVAFGSVISVQLLPALLLGPLGGVLADRFDRRLAMVVVDVIRFVLFASIPVVGFLVVRPTVVVAWTAVAMFLVQAAAMVWVPAKEAAVPNLLPRAGLEAANQLTLATTYGITPVLAAFIFAAMARLPSIRGRVDPVDLALWFDALTFLGSAGVVFFAIREISGRPGRPAGGRTTPGMWSEFASGLRYAAGAPLVRGLIVGVLGSFAGAGVVVGTARFYAASLGGGDAAFAILFAALFAGFGVGIVAGPRMVGGLSRRRWFGLSIVLAGAAVASLSVVPLLAGAVLGALVVGAGAGMAFLSGITLLGGGVTDEVRGRVFAFVQTAVRTTLIVTISVSSVLVGFGSSRHLRLGALAVDISTTRVLLFVAGACGALVGVAAFRQMDDRPGVPVLADLYAALRRRPPYAPRGRYIVIDGPAGVAAAQVASLAAWLQELGRDVVFTGSTTATATIRQAVALGAIVIVNASRGEPTGSPPPAEGPGTPKPDLVVRLDPDPRAQQESTAAAGPRLVLHAGSDHDVLAARIRARVADLIQPDQKPE